MKEVCNQLGRHQRDVRTLVLVRKIPTEKVGNAFAINEEGLRSLRVAFKQLDEDAKARGMKVLVPA